MGYLPSSIFLFFILAMGHFDWPITKRGKKALGGFSKQQFYVKMECFPFSSAI
jgi:hypothetical protein